MQVQALRFTARIKTKTAKQLFQLVVHLNKVVVTKFLDGVVKFQNSLLTLSLKSRKRSKYEIRVLNAQAILDEAKSSVNKSVIDLLQRVYIQPLALLKAKRHQV